MDPSPTKAKYNIWIKRAITQIWLLMDRSWKVRNDALRNGNKNNTISQSEYDKNNQKYYAQKRMKYLGGVNIYSARAWWNF